VSTAATTALNRIADALERIAESMEDAPERMAAPNRLRVNQILAQGIEDVPLPEPERCESVWSRDPWVRCVRDQGHTGACESVLFDEPLRWGNYKQEPEYPCDVVHFNRSAIICARAAGHMGFHRDPTGAVVWYDPDAGKDMLYSKMADNDEPEQECADVSAARRKAPCGCTHEEHQ
jgi:hypothetical protein